MAENTPRSILWSERTRSRSDFAIVQIPKTIPIDILYNKPSLGIALTLSSDPTTELYWDIEGTVDADTISNLNLPTSERREGSIPPIVTSRDIEKAKEQYGTNAGYITRDEQNPSLWHMRLRVPVNNVYHFLDQVWQPHNEKDRDLRYSWQLTQVDNASRAIPIKRTKDVTLEVRERTV